MDDPAEHRFAAPASKSRKAEFLKLVGAVTAVLSLVFGLQQAFVTLSESGEKSRRMNELQQLAVAQENAGDFPRAWSTRAEAFAVAESGGHFAKMLGRLSGERLGARHALEDLAMAWVRDLRFPHGKKLAEALDGIIPVLTRGASDANAARKASLLAHIGWANFYRWRDLHERHLDPAFHYRQALALDPGNWFAHTFLGFWQLRDPDRALAAREHFTAAIEAGGDARYIRKLQLMTLDDINENVEMIRVANEMRMRQERIDLTDRWRVFDAYYHALSMWSSNTTGMTRELRSAISIQDNISTYRWLSHDAEAPFDGDWKRDAVLAILLEEAGSPAEALALWESVKAQYQYPGDIVDESIRRLTSVATR